jgi:hypothetical protein
MMIGYSILIQDKPVLTKRVFYLVDSEEICLIILIAGIPSPLESETL